MGAKFMETAKPAFMVCGGTQKGQIWKRGRNQIKGFFSPVGDFGLCSVDNRNY